MLEVELGGVRYGFAEGLQTLRTLRREHPKIVAEGKGILGFLRVLFVNSLSFAFADFSSLKNKRCLFALTFSPSI